MRAATVRAPKRRCCALRPGGRNAVAYLGPAFSTKVLYFAGAGGWPTSASVRYCALLDRWTHEESRRLGRRVCSDQIERRLFRP
ncbi:8-oxoguanine DNA glycosylase OGG fold protein [Streptomyces luteogriseus]|uniref:8-oxoguanine DNA glycosylase OGG fold protein n=1 Tax=Streptomyces luteogriseus TaxID=68233 RepID=UPI0037A5F8A0